MQCPQFQTTFILRVEPCHQSNGCLYSYPIPHVRLPVYYAHKGATVLYNEVFYFNPLSIEDLSLSVSQHPALSVKSLHEGVQGQWTT